MPSYTQPEYATWSATYYPQPQAWGWGSGYTQPQQGWGGSQSTSEITASQQQTTTTATTVTVSDASQVLALTEGASAIYKGYTWSMSNGQLWWWDPNTSTWKWRYDGDTDWLAA